MISVVKCEEKNPSSSEILFIHMFVVTDTYGLANAAQLSLL